MANNITICVRVNNDDVYLTSGDVHHSFTAGELRRAAAAYGISINDAKLIRNGQTISDGEIVNDGDVIRTHFGKGEDGLR